MRKNLHCALGILTFAIGLQTAQVKIGNNPTTISAKNL